jgi:hypothetical protein
MKVAHPCRKGTVAPPEWESRNSARKAWVWMRELATGAANHAAVIRIEVVSSCLWGRGA